MTPRAPQLTLNNGITMPALGLGVFQSPPEETTAAVEAALATGYRHIDTAAGYGNEREVGEGIRRSGLDRSEVFIETKIWVSDYGYEQTLHGFDKSATKLGVEHIDLLILHQPMPQHFERTLEAYRALEKLLADGRVRAIGGQQLHAPPPHRAARPQQGHPRRQPSRAAPVPQPARRPGRRRRARHPHPGMVADRRHHLLPGWDEGRNSVLEDPVVVQIAAAHSKTPAQALLGWHLQQGRSAIPKSTNPARIAENLDVFDFTPSPDELSQLDALDTGRRHGPDPDEVDPTTFDLTIAEA